MGGTMGGREGGSEFGMEGWEGLGRRREGRPYVHKAQVNVASVASSGASVVDKASVEEGGKAIWSSRDDRLLQSG